MVLTLLMRKRMYSSLLLVQLTIDWEKIRAKIALEEEKELGRAEN